MRVMVVPAVLLLALTLACPATRRGGGDGGEGEGEGEERPVGASCPVEGVNLPLDVSAAAATRVTDSAPPNTSCIGSPRVVGPSTQVTLEGCVDIFGVGNSAQRGIVVEVFADGVDPSTAAPLASGQVFIRDDAGAIGGCNAGNENEPACRAFDCDSRGFYRLTGTVPTHVPLTMKIAAEDSTNVIDTYLWGLVFFDTEAVASVVNYEAALIFRSTWNSIPTLSGRQIIGGQTVGDGEGRAVVAGELHDCDDVILEDAVVNISGFDSTSMTVAYFDGDPDDPSPDLSRATSAEDGLFVVLNVVTDAGANTHTLAGGYKESCTGDDCTCTSLGSRTFMAFPDSVSIATLRGDFPVIQ